MNDGDWKDAKFISVNKGTNLALGAFPSDSGTYRWDGPTGYISGGAEILLSNMQLGQGGTYNVTLSNNCWATSDTSITVTVVDSLNLGSAYHWPSYSPTLAYNFRQEYPDLQMPTKDLPDCEGVVGAQSKGWWTFLWGADKNSLVTSNAITPLLERMNEDFAYFRDTFGWPPISGLKTATGVLFIYLVLVYAPITHRIPNWADGKVLPHTMVKVGRWYCFRITRFIVSILQITVPMPLINREPVFMKGFIRY